MLKKQQDYQVSLDKVTHTQNIIDYINDFNKLKPQILYNYGRDKQYVYGQVYFKVNPQSKKKQNYRFLLGKMADNKTRTQLEKICKKLFLEKVIGESVKV